MKSVGFVDTEHFDHHSNGAGHPERPERLNAIRAALAKRGLDTLVQHAVPTRIERALLTSVHTEAYVAQVERVCARGGGPLDPDTAVVAASWDAAILAAGGVVDAVHSVLDGRWQRAFCAVRPPGHHALPGRAMGFCLFANVALGAQAALNTGKVSRVAILDWDVHHGNGTQDIFWRRGDVMYASWHQFPFYPGTGAADEIGEGEGLGTTINHPVAAGGGNSEYMHGWNEVVRPALERFGPDIIIISAGFDADARDPLGGLTVTAKGFAQLSESVIRWSDTHCGGRVVSVLEGGYALAALAEDVPIHIETMF